MVKFLVKNFFFSKEGFTENRGSLSQVFYKEAVPKSSQQNTYAGVSF